MRAADLISAVQEALTEIERRLKQITLAEQGELPNATIAQDAVKQRQTAPAAGVLIPAR
jgi:hypothetical protein